VAGGLIVGKEGPLVHVGSCIASLLGQGGSLRYGLTCKWLRYLKNDRDRRDLVTCGAAAGVAAAFRAPVGGVLFALEEVTSWYLLQIFITHPPTFPSVWIILVLENSAFLVQCLQKKLMLLFSRSFHFCTPMLDSLFLFSHL